MALSVLDCQRHIAAPLVSKKTGAPITIRKVPDGNGLFLIIRDGEPRRAFWTYQHRSATGWTSKGFGGFPDVTPKQAREALEKHKVELRNGTAAAPIIVPRKAVAPVAGKPFPEVVAEWLAVAAVKWADKTRDAASRALCRLPLAAKAVNAITTDDVLASLLPLPERQRQDVRQNLARCLDFAAGRKWAAFGPDGNPARFENERRELWPAFTKSKKHHARVGRDDMPALYASIIDGDTARALRFLILTAARTGDIEDATWREIHPAGATFINADGDTEKLICDAWIIPERTKERERRIVPLPPQAMAILGERGKPDDLLFGKLASNAMLNLLQKTCPGKTVHGCRSTFRDWAIRQVVPLDHGATVRDLAELQQGHKLPDASTVERAYARDGLYDLRAPLMEKWAQYLCG
jgi:integrase